MVKPEDKVLDIADDSNYQEYYHVNIPFKTET
jgi:hypothetical protein